MENASKALIISGGVLIAIFLLTFFTFIITRVGERTASVYDDLQASEVSEFNQKFLNYDGYGFDPIPPISFQDVVSIVNLAVDNNRTQKLPTVIEVNVSGSHVVEQGDWAKIYDRDENNDRIFMDNIDLVKEPRGFSCEVNINPKTQLVDIITIKEKEDT